MVFKHCNCVAEILTKYPPVWADILLMADAVDDAVSELEQPVE